MTITLGYWLLPAFVTLATWYWAACRPLPADHGAALMGGLLVLAFRITVSIIVTLAVWLLYLLAYVVLE